MFIIWATNIESATPISKTLLKCVSCKVVSFGEVRLADIASHVFHSLTQIMNTICQLIYLVSFEK